MTAHCTVCGRPLRSARSIARGMGAVCEKRLGENRADGIRQTTEVLQMEIVKMDYEALSEEARQIVRASTDRIKALAGRSMQNLWEIGGELVKVKDSLDHGQFGDWLKLEFDWSERTAQNYMGLHRTFKYETVAFFTFGAKTAYQIAAPSTPPAVVEEIEELAAAGQAVSESEALEVIQKHKPAPKPKPSTSSPASSTPASDEIEGPDQDTPEPGAGQDVLSHDLDPAPEKRRMTYFDRPEGLDDKAFWDRYFILANQQDEETRLLARCGMFWLALGEHAATLGELLDLDNGQPVEHMRYFRHKFHEASVGTLCLVIHDDAGNDWRTTVLKDWSLRFYNDTPEARQFCVDALPVKEGGESDPERTESGQETDTPPAVALDDPIPLSQVATPYPAAAMAESLQYLFETYIPHLAAHFIEQAETEEERWMIDWMAQKVKTGRYDETMREITLMTRHAVVEEMIEQIQTTVPAESGHKAYLRKQEFSGHLWEIYERQQADAESEAAA